MKEVFIVDGLRTAIGNFNGTISNLSVAELGKTVVTQLLKNNNLRGPEIDEVLFGCILQAGQGQSVARQVAIHSEIPVEKTAMTVNMLCGSGMRTVALAAQAIMCNDADLILAGGAENMSQAPYLMKQARNGYKMGHGEILDSLISDGLTDVFNNYHMGVTAENIVEKYKLTREEQDQFALASQNKAEKATKEGKFTSEIVPITIPQKKGDALVFKSDEFIKLACTYDTLAKLRPAFKKDGTVTAGNASGINDGAACLLIASADAVKKYNLKPRARIVSYAYHGVDPKIMGMGPVEAVRLALSKAKWTLKDLELIEANEAFAAQSLGVGKELGWNPDIVNVNGGAIALGHPVGASGARILVTLMSEMNRRQAKKGLATLCIGGGMGIATCIEKV